MISPTFLIRFCLIACVYVNCSNPNSGRQRTENREVDAAVDTGTIKDNSNSFDSFTAEDNFDLRTENETPSLSAQQTSHEELALDSVSKNGKNYQANKGKSTNQTEQKSIKNEYDITGSLPDNYVKDGSVDYTKYVQSALNEHSNLVFPNFPILINATGLKVRSNSTIKFQDESIIILKPTEKAGYNIFEIRNANNVTLVNPVIVGDRKSHLAKDGQWGFGIGIYSSNEVRIIRPKISDCWGDGIYIGKSSDTKKIGKNVTIENAYIKNNRRNGISIICVDGLVLKDSYIGFTGGQSPEFGIDIEPNGYIDELKRIEITNLKTESNKAGGILIHLPRLYGGGIKNIDIRIDNHVDLKSPIGLRIQSYKMKAEDKGGIRGKIEVNNPRWEGNSIMPISAKSLLDRNIELVINNPIIVGEDNKERSKAAVKEIVSEAMNKNTSLKLR